MGKNNHGRGCRQRFFGGSLFWPEGAKMVMKQFVSAATHCISRRSVPEFVWLLSTATWMPAWAQTAVPLPEMATLETPSLTWVLPVLLLACGWAVWLVWRKRRDLQAGGGHAVQVLSVTPLGGRERVVTVRVEGRTLLLGVTPTQVTMLMELPSKAVASVADAKLGA
jgi:Flagellar biosynthesis protein, FliO